MRNRIAENVWFEHLDTEDLCACRGSCFFLLYFMFLLFCLHEISNRWNAEVDKEAI